MAVLNLPRPPSVNAMFRNVPGVGRVKTTDYKNWIKEAGWMLNAQRPQPIQGDYRLLVLVGPTRADIDNLTKAINDLLQSHGVVENDNKCQGAHMERSNDVAKGAVHCVVQEAEADTWVPLGEAVGNVIKNIGKGVR